ncbi:Monothiol glutaredoxin-S11 [Zea mays]|uniref:Monothiol glutaredoxin-S11 n=1 Tax=Zea mays TaxID=4577 RepID=A0A3L6DRR0_MAIZE|nr:Monothiol glutaredoxin-S11 [Zea mays]
MLASATRAGTSSTTKPDHAAGAVHGAGAGAGGTPIVVTDGGQEVTVSQFVAQLGVLDTEELAIVNSTFRKAQGSRLSGIIEETRRSGESTTSTLESETWAMESLETELFDNVCASIQKSLGKPDKLLETVMEEASLGTMAEPLLMARTQKNKATAHHLGLLKQKGVNILKQEGVKFGSFDILTDNDVREGMKKFSNWPTVPQLYCKGELLGGCDIVIAMHDSGELKDVFEEHNIPLKPQGSKNEEAGQPESATEKGGAVAEPIGLTDAQKARLESLINSSPVMVFIKGTPEEPRCGFSGKLVHILKQENIPFSSFDILSDDEVRQGLKVLSNWPSYPQLYIKGELVGGSDIVMEMHKSGELKKVLSEKGVIPKESLEDRLKSLVSSAPVMLLMKGTPDAPRCGFSSKVVNALKKEGVSFGSFDILSDEEVRQGLKTYSNWPTFPQLYYKSELIGGCDIVLEMEKSGDLKSTLSE